MSTMSFSRRKMLAAVAAAGGAARLGPFLPRSVYAATTPKRILTVFHPMGYLESSFWPTGTGTNYTLGETQSALTPFKSKLLYLDGLALYGPQYFFGNDDNEHSAGGNMVFTGAKKRGFATGPSVEQAIAEYQYKQTQTQFKALALGVNAGAPVEHSAVFYSKAQTPVTAQGSVRATFDMLFKNSSAPTTPGGTTTPVDTAGIERARKQQQSVLNLVKGDLSRIRALAGKDDKEKCDAHLDGISGLENRLKLTSSSGGPPSTPAAGGGGGGCAKPPTPGILASVVDRTHGQMDLIAAAFACDLTRAASLQLGICDGSIDEAVPGINQHNTTHSVADKGGQQGDLDNHKKYDRWFAARWAYLLGKLDSIKEGEGTMLDNTLILFGSDTTTTQQFALGPHNHFRFPLWMAGGGNFAFKTGQAIKLSSPNKAPGNAGEVAQWTVHQRLLTSICQSFGMPVETFGDNDPGRGPLTALTKAV